MLGVISQTRRPDDHCHKGFLVHGFRNNKFLSRSEVSIRSRAELVPKTRDFKAISSRIVDHRAGMILCGKLKSMQGLQPYQHFATVGKRMRMCTCKLGASLLLHRTCAVPHPLSSVVEVRARYILTLAPRTARLKKLQ